jgi:hypothetical protein
MAHGTQNYQQELNIVVKQSAEGFVDLPSRVSSLPTCLPNKDILVRNVGSTHIGSIVEVRDEKHSKGALVVVPNISTYSDHSSFVAHQASQRPANLQNSGGIKVCERQLPALAQGESINQLRKH